MPRPTKNRRICALPGTSEFIPSTAGCQETVVLGLDEYEVIRLIDLLGLTQEDCAAQMHVARTTVQAIHETALRKLADALVNGKRLKICGGCYDVCPHSGNCCGQSCARLYCGGKCCESAENGCCACPKKEET